MAQKVAQVIEKKWGSQIEEQTGDTYQPLQQNIETSDTDRSDEESENVCSVCETVYQGSIKCTICQEYCHEVPPCSVTNIGCDETLCICQLCNRSETIAAERRDANLNQRKQAENMLSACKTIQASYCRG